MLIVPVTVLSLQKKVIYDSLENRSESFKRSSERDNEKKGKQRKKEESFRVIRKSSVRCMVVTFGRQARGFGE